MDAAKDKAYPVRVYLLRDDMLWTPNAKSEGPAACGRSRLSAGFDGTVTTENEMEEGKELYKKGELPAGTHIEPCPVCGADAELWQYSKDFKNGPIEKVVMCTNGERFGPQGGAANEGCLLYMPPQDFYRGRIVEAVKFWNEYAKVLNAQRRGRNWKRARVQREVTPNAELRGRPLADGPA